MIQQIKVTLANRPGTLELAVSALAEAGVDIKALEVNERRGGEMGEAHLIVTHVERALEALRAAGQDVATEPALVVEMPDRPGGLASILKVLAAEAINVRYLYAFVTRLEGKSLAVLTLADLERGRRVLEGAGFTLLTEKRLAEQTSAPAPQPGLADHLGGDFIW